MSKVDWITWRTNPKEIINPEVINENLANYTTNFKNLINNNIYENIKLEIDKGGLNDKSLNLNGISPSSVGTNNVINKINSLINNIDILKEKIVLEAEEQKQLEKEELIDAITKKIEEQKKILENTNNLKNKLTTSNDVISLEEVNKTIEITEERISLLNEKLEKAKMI